MRRGCHIALIITIAIIIISPMPVIVVDFVIVAILVTSVTFAISIFIHILPGAIVYASLPPIVVPLMTIIAVATAAATPLSIRIIPVRIVVVVAVATATLCPPTLFAFPPFFGAAHGLSIDPTRMRWRLIVVLSSVCSWRIHLLLLLPRLTMEAEQTLTATFTVAVTIRSVNNIL